MDLERKNKYFRESGYQKYSTLPVNVSSFGGSITRTWSFLDMLEAGQHKTIWNIKELSCSWAGGLKLSQSLRWNNLGLAAKLHYYWLGQSTLYHHFSCHETVCWCLLNVHRSLWKLVTKWPEDLFQYASSTKRGLVGLKL